MTQSGYGQLLPPWPTWLGLLAGLAAKQALILSTTTQILSFCSNGFWPQRKVVCKLILILSWGKTSFYLFGLIWIFSMEGKLLMVVLGVGSVGRTCLLLSAFPPALRALVNYEGSGGSTHRCIICAAHWASYSIHRQWSTWVCPKTVESEGSKFWTLIRWWDTGALSRGTLDTLSNNWREFGPAASPDSTTVRALWSAVIHPLLKPLTLPSP